MPSVEWLEEQPREYRESVLPPSVRVRVAVEAGIGLTWYRYVGDHGRIVSLEHFGASADAKTLFAAYGLHPRERRHRRGGIPHRGPRLMRAPEGR